MVMTFGAYDFFVHRRNRKIVDAAAKFNSIVSSLFPENVRERLFADAEEKLRKKEKIQAFDTIDDFMATEGSLDDENVKAHDRPVCTGLVFTGSIIVRSQHFVGIDRRFVPRDINFVCRVSQLTKFCQHERYSFHLIFDFWIALLDSPLGLRLGSQHKCSSSWSRFTLASTKLLKDVGYTRSVL